MLGLTRCGNVSRPWHVFPWLFLSFDHLGLSDFSVLHKNILQFISYYNYLVHLPSIPQMLIELLKCARLNVRGMGGLGVADKDKSDMLLLSWSLRSL